jgi:hypothetical protein
MIGLVLAANIVAGTYAYKTQYNGVNLGTSTLTVKGDAGSTQISEQTSGSYSGTSGNANATLVLNADLSPVSYRASGSMGGSPIADSATITGSNAQVTNAQGSLVSFQLENGAKHFVVVDLGTLAGFFPLPAQMKAWNNDPVQALIPSFGQSFPFTPRADTSLQRPTGVPAADVALVFTGHTQFNVWYDPTTLVPDEIDVPAQNLLITRTQ